MKLYEARVERPDGVARGYIVAPTEERTAELIIDHDLELGLPSPAFSLDRIDETLPEDRRIGLDDLLDGAPVGFASYREPIGWVSHVAAVQKLRLFRIEDDRGDNTFIIAPDRNTAVAIYCVELRIDDGEQRQFSMFDGLADLPADRMTNLPALLEFGPVGVVEYKEGHGWLAW